jgi:hypothetical protein
MTRGWETVNEWGDDALCAAGEFFSANRRLLLLTVGVGVLAYGYELTHLTFSIDEEVLWQAPDSLAVWPAQRRWGMYLLQRFVLPDAGYPFTSAALAILFLSLAAILLADKWRTSATAQAVFCVLFVSFPTFAHIQLFDYMGAHCGLAVLLVVAGYRLFAAADRPGVPLARQVALLGPAFAVLTLATATHQSLLAVFPTLLALDLTVDAFRNELTVPAAIKRTGVAAVLTIAAAVAAYGVPLAAGLRSNGYVESYFRWGTDSARLILARLWANAVPFVSGRSMTYSSVPTMAVAAGGLLILAWRRARPALASAATLALLVGPLAIHIAFGNWMPSRSMMAVPFAFAGMWYLLFEFSGKAIRAAVLVFACYVTIWHSSVISRLSFAQELSYHADTLVGSRVLDLMYDVRPGLAHDGTPLMFVGMIEARRSPLFLSEEVFGGSFWRWDNGNPGRMLLFLQALGFPMSAQLAPVKDWDHARAIARSMPAFPDRGCVQFRDGILIVKLSESQ